MPLTMTRRLFATALVAALLAAAPAAQAPATGQRLISLVPAATENTIDEAVAPHVKATIVAEGANGPTTPGADDILKDAGITVLPDILTNAGGVTVSYFEWVQGLQNFFWDKKRVDDELQKVMERAFDQVNAKADEADCDYRSAAYTLAISRVAEALKLKGLFP